MRIESNPDRLPLPKPEPRGKKAPKRIKVKGDYEWVKTRKQYLEGKQNHQGYYQCELCSRYAISVDVHHKQTRGARRDLKYDLENLIALCHECHMRQHKQIK